MITKIAAAALYTEHQQKAVEFWTKQVGFETHRKMPMDQTTSWIEVGPPGDASCLVIYPRSMMQDWSERKPSIVFETDDVRKTFEEMHGRGVQFTHEPKELGWRWFAIFLDPDGNGFGLRGRENNR
jgi:lactoylglutathione lyase